MALIFFGSTDIGSPKHTSRFLVPFLKWLIPDISAETLEAAQLAVRKTAHMSEYGLLALLTWTCRKLETSNWRTWNRKEFWWIVAVCTLYAGTDELHQLFVASRGSSVVDVGIDGVGASAALLLLWLVGRWRNVWKNYGTPAPAS